MKSLPDSDKQTFRALFETMEAIKQIELLVSGDRSIKYNGRKRPHKAAIYNAILLWLARQPAEVQRQVVGEGMKLVNTFMDAGGQNLEIGEQKSVVPQDPKTRKRKQA